MSDEKCPCGSSLMFAACCKPFIDGAAEAATPEILMRSRYTAFVRRDLDYLKKTWHPETVPDLTADEPNNWVSLAILGSEVDDDGEHGEVEFVAKLVVGDCLETLHEISDFEKIAGRWVYHSGEFVDEGAPPVKISMKTPCPCGSGEKFKHCHFGR